MVKYQPTISEWYVEVWTQNSWNLSKYFIHERSGRWDTADFWAIFLSSKSLKSESIFFDVEFIEGCFQCLHKKWYVNKTMYFKFINHKQWLVLFTIVSIKWSVLSLSLSLSLSSKPPSPLPVLLWPHNEGGLEHFKVTHNASTMCHKLESSS